MATLKNTTINDTGFIQLPSGTTAQRPSAATGQMRYNSTLKTVEHYVSRWRYLPDIVVGNLVARYDAAEPGSYSGSGTTWNDISGNSKTATLTNGPGYTTEYGGGITFDGTDDYVVMPNGLLTQNDFAVTVWCKNNATPSYGTLFANYPAGNVQLMYGPSFLAFWLGNSSAYADGAFFYTTGPISFTIGRSGDQTYLYANDTLAKQGSATAATGGNVEFRMGTNTSGTERFSGTIYTCLVYSRMLSVNEITQNYHALRSRFGV
jgi:hypothetical protein